MLPRGAWVCAERCPSGLARGERHSDEMGRIRVLGQIKWGMRKLLSKLRHGNADLVERQTEDT